MSFHAFTSMIVSARRTAPFLVCALAAGALALHGCAGPDEPYPTLSSVPEAPEDFMSPEEIADIVTSLSELGAAMGQGMVDGN